MLNCDTITLTTNDTTISHTDTTIMTIDSSTILISELNKKIVFTVHTAPYIQHPVTISNNFTKLYMNRLTPNITQTYNNYKNCKLNIYEYSNPDSTLIAEYENLQFDSYDDLLSFINNNITNSSNQIISPLTLECYIVERQTIDPLKRIYGLNRFYGTLKGADSNKSNHASLNSDVRLDTRNDFLGKIYNDLLGVSLTTNFDSYCNTVWFPKTYNKIFTHHRQRISFPNGQSGYRSYLDNEDSTIGNDTSAILRGLEFQSQMYYKMESGNTNIKSLQPNNYDKDILSGGSIIRVCLYRNYMDSNKYIFFIKPVGMDCYHLGYNFKLPKTNMKVYIEYKKPNSPSKFLFIKDMQLDPVNYNRNFGMNTAITLNNNDFINKIYNSGDISHMRSDTIISQFRFFYMSDSGISYKPSRLFKVFNNLNEVNLSILPIF